MLNQFDKPYNHKEIEEKIYELWEKSGFFNPDKLPINKIKNSRWQSHRGSSMESGQKSSGYARSRIARRVKNFCIIMPPPNSNGSLHLGHALTIALEDIMIRYKRMRGFKTLWLPGADHAGFEAQVVYEKKLEKEGRNRFQIPKKQLWQEMWDFVQINKTIMESQLRKLGASCDWSRKKFTLDPDIISETQDTFIKMHKEKLIYRGEKIVNWCPKHQTAFSDLEIKYEEKNDPLYYIKYGPITLATGRLETKFGDTAIAVHPKDKRYKKFIGKEIEIETLIGKNKIKIIADEAVDPDFGTGAVKVTPAHDPTDFEIWQRHKNEMRGPIEVIDKFGRMNLLEHFSNNPETEKYHGLKTAEARKIIAEEMEKKGLIVKIDHNYKHNVGFCYKCGNVLEPRLLPQWFIKIKPLAKPAIEAVKKGKIKFISRKFEKIYFHWMKNIHDWNISRQIVWGISIPAWFCECGEIIIQKEKPKKCPKCSIGKIERDSDVFDTWFSSGQWPFAALGFNKFQNSSKSKTKNQKSKIKNDYETFYPTDVMETAWDSLFFWVARMIMLGLYKTKKIPFKYVYLHGLVRDKDKQKMSKSKGNVIDPLGIVADYGADALRMALIVGNTPGADLSFSEEKIRGYRNFANKIWQASRFVLSQTANSKLGIRVAAKTTMTRLRQNSELQFKNQNLNLTNYDKKRLKEFNVFKKKITKYMESFKFYIAAEEIYHYFWHTFCDKIIEKSKTKLYGKNIAEKTSAQYTLFSIFFGCLKLLHPFMPFITEKIYQELPKKEAKFLMVEKW